MPLENDQSLTQKYRLLLSINSLATQNPDWKDAVLAMVNCAQEVLHCDRVIGYQVLSESLTPDIFFAHTYQPEVDEDQIISSEEFATDLVRKGFALLAPVILDIEKPPASMCGVQIPLIEQQKGVLVFIRPAHCPFNPDDLQFVSFLANQIAMVYGKACALTALKRSETRQKNEVQQEDSIAFIAHELSTPIGYIKGYTTTLLRSDTTWTPEKQVEILQIIDQETDRLGSLVQNLLDSNRLQNGQMVLNFQPVRLDALMNDVISRARQKHPDRIFHINYQPHLPPIQADAQRMVQVYENIIGNALKYAPSSDVWVTINMVNEGIRTTITDQGAGIPQHYLPYLFDRYFRVPEPYSAVPGSGLGLFISKKIIQAHFGKITVTSEVGKGTTFEITLPILHP
ncbi:MAG TPA: GAF domain-containing sensor histidine kinase [Anaerolineaceae bacterium]